MRNQRGVSLIELLLAVAIVSFVVSMLTLFFPKASQNIVNNRHRWGAMSLAVSQIEDLKKQPYSYIDVTPQARFTAPANATCDCAAQDFTAGIPAEPPIPSTGTAYLRQTCINFVTFTAGSGAATPQCTGDTGSKYIRVRVSWVSGSLASAIDQESVIARY
jgi:prepilin-type N-terminal cleavage/methylation domain-containing protein